MVARRPLRRETRSESVFSDLWRGDGAARAPPPGRPPRARPRGRRARAPSGRPGAHATGARALTARGAVAQAAGQTHTKDKAEIRVVLAMLRDATPAESRAARLRRGLPPRREPPPSRAGTAAARRAKPRPVPRGHPGPTCPSDGAGGVAAGLARTEPRASLTAAPRSLLGVGSPAAPACRAGRAREDPGPAGWWPRAGPARVRARLAGWSPPRVAAGWPGARSACASPAGRRPRDETPAPRGSSAQRGRIEGPVTEPPLGEYALPIKGDGGAARGGPGITAHLPLAERRPSARAPLPRVSSGRGRGSSGGALRR